MRSRNQSILVIHGFCVACMQPDVPDCVRGSAARRHAALCRLCGSGPCAGAWSRGGHRHRFDFKECGRVNLFRTTQLDIIYSTLFIKLLIELSSIFVLWRRPHAPRATAAVAIIESCGVTCGMLSEPMAPCCYRANTELPASAGRPARRLRMGRS